MIVILMKRNDLNRKLVRYSVVLHAEAGSSLLKCARRSQPTRLQLVSVLQPLSRRHGNGERGATAQRGRVHKCQWKIGAFALLPAATVSRPNPPGNRSDPLKSDVRQVIVKYLSVVNAKISEDRPFKKIVPIFPQVFFYRIYKFYFIQQRK